FALLILFAGLVVFAKAEDFYNEDEDIEDFEDEVKFTELVEDKDDFDEEDFEDNNDKPKLKQRLGKHGGLRAFLRKCKARNMTLKQCLNVKICSILLKKCGEREGKICQKIKEICSKDKEVEEDDDVQDEDEKPVQLPERLG
ncbi:hypothetical protein, partial [Salmonella sp. s51933]|uniref:hypothetical protein n=1 Tax=Salmonella sp. s51933 TaxID=3160127 RepID=UPI00375425A9